MFAGVDNTWRIAEEEIFGPVLVAIPWDRRGDAIRMANDCHYGLAAYVWSPTSATPFHTAHRIESGWIQVNQGVGRSPDHCYGGYKPAASDASTPSRACSTASRSARA